jgi:hypothetical protein
MRARAALEQVEGSATIAAMHRMTLQKHKDRQNKRGVKALFVA